MAVTAQAEGPAPASDVLVDRFMAVIPDPGSDPDPDELARLTALDPERSMEIASILQRFSRCNNMNAANVLRRVVATLGDARLTRLIAFYEGEDFRIFYGLVARPDEALSDQERAERNRIIAAYPLADLRAAMQVSNPAFSAERARAMARRCETERDADLELLGIRVANQQ